MIATQPRHDQCIPRQLAHKWSLDEVFITDYATVSSREMVLGAQVPRAHGFYVEFPAQNRRPDLALLIEVCRQACFVVAHEQFGVPLEGNVHQFLFQDLDARYTDDAVPLDTSRPVNLVVESTVERVWKRGSAPSGLAWHFVIRSEGMRIAEVRIRMTWIDRVKWREMRNFMRRSRGLPEELVRPPLTPEVLAPAEVGRMNPENVVLASMEQEGERFTAIPRVDVRHPVLFDHPIDHIYGMVQLEICRQLAVAAVSRTHRVPPEDLELAGFTTSFSSVAEFDLVTDASARFLAPGFPSTAVAAGEGSRQGVPLAVSIKQGARVTSESTIWIRQRGAQPSTTEES